MRYLDQTKIYTKYQNKWLALTEDNKVISAGNTWEEASKKASRKGYKEPLIIRIPNLAYGYLLA